MSILDALKLPKQKLYIFYNEAHRQRTLDLLIYSKAQNTKACTDEIQDSLRIHGKYTDGFYDNELDRLFMDMNNGK
jgi:hypothetical protein